MARGWESKSVEDQISSKEAESDTRGKKKLNQLEIEKRAKLEALQLARTRTLIDLENTRDPRYRALLERTMAHLDTQLAELG